jgi:hypothetical protein
MASESGAVSPLWSMWLKEYLPDCSVVALDEASYSTEGKRLGCDQFLFIRRCRVTPTAVKPTTMPRIVDSHGSGTTGVLVDNVGVDAFVVDSVGRVSVSEVIVAEVCTEMSWISRTRNGTPCMHVVATLFST